LFTEEGVVSLSVNKSAPEGVVEVPVILFASITIHVDLNFVVGKSKSHPKV
jgi:hypothetical protein